MRSDGDRPMGSEAAPPVEDLRREALLYLEWVRGAAGRFVTREPRAASPAGASPVSDPTLVPTLMAPAPPVAARSPDGGPDPESGGELGTAAGVGSVTVPPEARRATPTVPAASTDAPTGPVRGADDLSGLAQEAAACRRCPLAESRSSVVFGEGPSRPRLLLIGEAPSVEEDATGRPFVGSVGELLDRMLAAIGLTRDDVYVTNTVKCRPPGHRPPSAQEVDACRPFLDAQFDALRPELVLLLGPVATRAVLRTDRGLAARRGALTTTPAGVAALATYHPEYLERYPSFKRAAWDDLRLAAATLGLTIPPAAGSSRPNPAG